MTEIMRLIQPVVALALLVTGLASLISVLTRRLRRDINRARRVKERLRNLSGHQEVPRPRRQLLMRGLRPSELFDNLAAGFTELAFISIDKDSILTIISTN